MCCSHDESWYEVFEKACRTDYGGGLSWKFFLEVGVVR